MDFAFAEDQEELAALARRLLGELATPDRAVAAHVERLWPTMSGAGLVGIALADELGGSGRGIVEACLVAREVGRAVAPVPYSPVVAAAVALARLPAKLRPADLLADVAEGRMVVLPAVPLRDEERAAVALKPVDGGCTAHGGLPFVPWAPIADRLLVAVDDPGGVPAVVVVDPAAAEVEIEPLRTSGDLPCGRVVFDGLLLAPQQVLTGAPAAAVLRTARSTALVLAAAEVCGAAEAALRLTAAYTRERRQFGRPLGSFQAVASRAADGFIDLQAMTWTMWKAAGLLDRQPDSRAAGEAVSVARFWAAEGGHRVAASAQHLHGGVGVDLDYPLHRFFFRLKQLELGMGGAAAHLAELGRSLAADERGS